MLIALAGPSRSGKGTSAIVAKAVAEAHGLTFRERQLSGPGKQYVASAFRPDITEEEAIAWFDVLKSYDGVHMTVSHNVDATDEDRSPTGKVREALATVTLQQYLQRMLQGARDRWGADFWTDKLLPLGDDPVWGNAGWKAWWPSFTRKIDENTVEECEVCVVSDLRQVSEARRVKELGGIVVECFRLDHDDAYVTGKDHVTEQRLPAELVDHVLMNDGPLGQLEARAIDLFTDLLTKGTR